MKSNQKIILNQIGFKKNVQKTVYTFDEIANFFVVEKMRDCHFEEVHRGDLIKQASLSGDVYFGDFTDLSEEGIYRIKVGELNSRIFTIDEKLHGPIQRTLLNFVTQQSCASNLGWHGKCHESDHIVLKSGEKRDLSGGFHQSSDLRKWSWGISLGMIGLLEYSILASPSWNVGEIEREIKHGCDYYMKLVLDDGSILDSCFIPVDYDGTNLPRTDDNHLRIHGKGFSDYGISWNRREYYERPTASPAHWFTIRFLALASRFFRQSDAEYADLCLEYAWRIWRFMERNAESTYNYTFPTFPPLGHDPVAKWWAPFYKDSILEISGRAAAAIELKIASGENDLDQIIANDLDAICLNQISGTASLADGAFWEGKGSRLANNYHYFFTTNVPTALYKGIELLSQSSHVSTWKTALARICDQYLGTLRMNGFHRIHGTLFTEDVFESGACFSFSEELSSDKPEAFLAGKANDLEIYFKYYSFCYNLDLSAAGIVLKHAAQILQNPEYAKAAQHQIDWLLGANPFDASSVEGLGYNNPHRGVFGEFFPPVPQIPGGVYTGITQHSFTSEAFGLECEYDLPETTWFMHLLQL